MNQTFIDGESRSASVFPREPGGCQSRLGSDGCESDSLQPLFIVGIHRRCGSNFVYNVLGLDAQFQGPEPISEDYLLYSAHLLDEYVSDTAHRWWKKRFDDPLEYEDVKRSLRRQLGDGMLATLRERIHPEKRLLTKTPDPDNIRHFFDFFPRAKLVLLLRDGRDVVESSYKSWPSESRAHWTRAWARGARIILDFVKDAPQTTLGRYLVLKYEDLLADRSHVERLLTFAGIDPANYPWDQFESLPIVGSSVYRGGRDRLHWDPVANAGDFNPLGRWDHWGWWRKREFKRLAGRELIELGYVANDRW
jgi:hypothetical protein